ncbi:hypothetical protein D3C86_1768150 [compost metagenome]
MVPAGAGGDDHRQFVDFQQVTPQTESTSRIALSQYNLGETFPALLSTGNHLRRDPPYSVCGLSAGAQRWAV